MLPPPSPRGGCSYSDTHDPAGPHQVDLDSSDLVPGHTARDDESPSAIVEGRRLDRVVAAVDAPAMDAPPPLDRSLAEAWARWFGGLQQASWSRVADELRLLRARDFIDRCYDRPLDLEVIARQAHFSRYHFLRAFRRAYAITPHQYLTQRRLDRARDLLEEGELSVTDVCLAVGFQSLGSFSTLFRRHVGRSPADYRRALIQSAGIPRVRAAIPTCFLHHYRVR